MVDYEQNIVTVGGGSGLPVVNEALLRTAKVDFITAIVTPFDNGGSTRMDRLDSYGTQIGYADAIRVLFSLIDPEQLDPNKVATLKRWFTQRDEKDRVPARGIVHNSFTADNGISQIERDFCSLGVNLKGEVLFSSTKSSQIVFTTEDNDYFEGEDMLDIRSTTPDTVRNMKLKPEIDAFPKAIEAIKKAKLIILSCGSVHGSVLCNFLPTGMKEAMEETAAKVYWVTNLTSTKNETDEATPISMVRLAEKYTGIQISGLIVPQMTREQFNEEHPEVADRYKKRESSHFLGWSEDQLDEAHSAGIEIVKHDAIKIIRINLPEDAYKLIVRHDPVKLAQSLKSIV